MDEIQRLEKPSLFLKELYDLLLPFKIIYSCSLQLELKDKLKENPAGRSRMIVINRLCLSGIMGFAGPVTEDQPPSLGIFLSRRDAWVIKELIQKQGETVVFNLGYRLYKLVFYPLIKMIAVLLVHYSSPSWCIAAGCTRKL